MSGDFSGLAVVGAREMAFGGEVRVFEPDATGFCPSRCLSCASVLSELFDLFGAGEVALRLAANGDRGVSGLVTERGEFALRSFDDGLAELWARAGAEAAAKIKKKKIRALFIMPASDAVKRRRTSFN
jgi:hypothetical protein